MKTNLTTKIVFYTGIIVIIAISNYGILINAENHLSEYHQSILHSHDVISSSEQFIGHMKDSETGQRGFLLTRNHDYLEIFNIGIKNAGTDLKKLFDLTKGDEKQQIRLDKLSQLKQEKELELKQTIMLADRGKISEAMAIVNTHKGKIAMDHIRMVMREILSTEKDLLKSQKDAYIAYRSNLSRLFIIEVIVLIFIVICIGFFSQRKIAKPLSILKDTIENKRNMDDIYKIVIAQKDEIGVLANAFIKMDNDINLKNKEKDALISDLKNALDEVKTLKGIIPICCYCHKIRDDEGAWNQLEQYISNHSAAEFSHGICPECYEKIVEKEGLSKRR